MPATPDAQGFDLNRPTIVALLILLGALTGLPTLIGVILAYVWRAEASNAPWEESHFAFHIRGFWITVVAVVLLTVLTVLSFGLLAPLFALVALWLGVRALVSMVNAQNKAPMPNPDSLFW